MADVKSLQQALKVIGSLQEFDRLQTQRAFSVDHPTTGQALKRWWMKEHRSANIKAIEDVFSRAFDQAESLKQEPGQRKAQQLLARLRDDIERGRLGMLNLRTTYQGDEATVAALTLLDEQITDRLKQLDWENPVLGIHRPTRIAIDEPEEQEVDH